MQIQQTPQSRFPLRQRTFEILERGKRQDRASVIFDAGMVGLIIANVASTVLETVPGIAADWGTALARFDTVCVAVFIVEYALRLWAAPGNPAYRGMSEWRARLSHAATPMLILDLIVILPAFLTIFWEQNAGIIRILRIFRFYRLARYVPALSTLGSVLAAEWRRLFGTLVLFASLLLISAALMYSAESALQPDKFGSIPAAMWWATVTLSTVGYGDVIPVSDVGRIIAGITMILGIMFFALPVAIVATGFQEEIKRHDFVVNFALVGRVPLFSGLDAGAIAQLVGMLVARRVATGTAIVTKGEEADAMYFIVSGAVEVEVGDRPIKLREGDFFGEIALVAATTRTATVIAAQPSELLRLDARDFRRLCARNPEIGAAVKEVAIQRLGRSRQPSGGKREAAHRRAGPKRGRSGR